ncbi:MAG TPA: hypothetical protein VHT91_28170 [Kofleriaceae bacterium]|jgi:hypothetical protein|nr:hypothetical protein [Kofleriaceae bacterium]
MHRLAGCVVALTAACSVDIPDVHPGVCDPNAGFVQLAPVAGLGELGEQTARLSPDELTIVFSRELPALVPRYGDLYVAHRADRGDDFDDVTALDAVNSDADEFSASFSEDMLTLYFDRQVEGGRYEILAATRTRSSDAFGGPVTILLGADSSSNFEPFAAAGAIFFASTRSSGVANLFSASGAGTSFASPAPVMPPTSQVAYEHPVVAVDGLTIYFSAPPDSSTKRDIWTAARSARDQPFGAPHPVAALDTASIEFPTWISSDSCRLYFMTDRTQSTLKPNFELWMASRRTP